MGGGGDVCTGHPPHPKKWGGGGGIHPPIPPGIYASDMNRYQNDEYLKSILYTENSVFEYIYTLYIFTIYYDKQKRKIKKDQNFAHTLICSFIAQILPELDTLAKFWRAQCPLPPPPHMPMPVQYIKEF